MRKLAVERQLEVIGQAANKICDYFTIPCEKRHVFPLNYRIFKVYYLKIVNIKERV
jgi:hypothetical protein